MPIFCSEDPILMGGMNQSMFMVVVADDMSDLHAFKRRWDGSLWLMSSSEREIWKTSPLGDESVRLGLKDKVIQVRLTLPDRGLQMHKSKTQIRALVRQKHSQFIYDQGYAIIPKGYIPLLNVILRDQYARQSGMGKTAEAEKFFQTERRGKLIDLLRFGQWAENPEHSDLQKLNSMLEKIDLGRRKDLTFSASQESKSAVVTERYTPNTVAPPSVKVETPKTGAFWESDYAKRNL